MSELLPENSHFHIAHHGCLNRFPKRFLNLATLLANLISSLGLIEALLTQADFVNFSIRSPGSVFASLECYNFISSKEIKMRLFFSYLRLFSKFKY